MEAVHLAFDEYVTGETDLNKCPILLLHGLFWNKYMLRELAHDLCIATRRKVFCMDLRNHGESPFCEECGTIVMAEDLKRFIKDRGLERVAFVCHSFSSTVAYHVLVDQPQAVEKAVMIDYPPIPEKAQHLYREHVQSHFMAQNRFLQTLDPSLTLSEAKTKIKNLSKGTTEAQRIILEKMAYDLTKVNNKFQWKTNYKFLIDKYEEGNFWTKPRGSSNHEILIIRSEGSLIVSDEKFAAVLRYNPNAKLMEMPGTSHLLMFERQEEFLGAVKDFLS